MKMFSYFASAVMCLTLIPGLGYSLTEQEAEEIGREAYIYGYPLVTMDMTRQVMTNVEEPKDSHAPMGQFYHSATYPTASFRDVTAPNADTLYSTAWIDLSKEPFVLHVPDVGSRYYLMPMLDGWTEVFADPGTRTTGTGSGNYAITGPGWNGQLPGGMKEIKSATNLVWILGRTYCTGTKEDYQSVHAIQKQYALVPLSSFGKPYTPEIGSIDPNIDMKKPVRDQVNALSAEAFFKRLAALMKNNPPAAADAAMVAKMAQIGLTPGKDFDLSNKDEGVRKALEKAPKLALEKINAHAKEAGKIVNGWVFTKKTGAYGTDYLQRAYVALIGLGANLPKDAIYPTTNEDTAGKPLDGANRYIMHFAKEQIPPVNGFWSLTMYDDQYFFVANPLNRFTLSPRDPLKFNSDGSLDLHIQNESPGKEKESNWLPSPKGKFNLMLRLYWPKETVLDGTWQPPGVEAVK